MPALAGGLQAAHESGVLHRGVKPSVVHLGRGGAKLTDFGLDGLQRPTVPDYVASWIHIAPELIANEADQPVDERADVYSLASVLYHAVAGRAPMAEVATGSDDPAGRGAGGAGLITGILTRTAPPLGQDLAPRWLDELLAQALSKDPAQRPGSATELRAALRANEPVATVAPPGRASLVASAP